MQMKQSVLSAGLERHRSVGAPISRPATCLRAAVTNGSTIASSNGAGAKKQKAAPFINIIPNNGQWPNGIPPVMGAHLMASGIVAPVSVSKGPGIDVTPHPFQYHDAETNTIIQLHASSAAAANGIARLVTDSAAAAVKAKGSFTLVLSGGSLLNSLAPLASAKGLDWSKTHVFFVDERNVAHDSPDSNYRAAQEVLLSKVPIPAGNVHAIHEGLPVAGAATNYEGRLLGLPASALPRDADGMPVFDLILLGIGPDGHVASLFPNTAATAATRGWVLPVANSPKPPAERITMTMPVINAAKEVAIVALGESKAEIVQRALEVQSLPGALPAQLVRPKAGVLRWIVDAMSAQHLDIAGWDDQRSYPRSQIAKD